MSPSGKASTYVSFASVMHTLGRARHTHPCKGLAMLCLPYRMSSMFCFVATHAMVPSRKCAVPSAQAHYLTHISINTTAALCWVRRVAALHFAMCLWPCTQAFRMHACCVAYASSS